MLYHNIVYYVKVHEGSDVDTTMFPELFIGDNGKENGNHHIKIGIANLGSVRMEVVHPP